MADDPTPAIGFVCRSAFAADKAGNLFGTTASKGGSIACQGNGTVFEATP
jgi:hypothetical protein